MSIKSRFEAGLKRPGAVIAMLAGSLIVGAGVLSVSTQQKHPIRIPAGTTEQPWDHHGERAFLPPSGEDDLVNCGDISTALSATPFRKHEVTAKFNGTLERYVICGSAGFPLDDQYPVVSFKPTEAGK